ncbi:MAG: hypothetical protein HYU55_06030 [Nocardioides sp.]|nr:hypothetical protein [Nocardioides sp.]
MKILGVAVAGCAVLVAAPAVAGQEDAATGGGQILVGSDGGAGDTIAFTARGTADAASGQVQYVDREGGTGQGQTVSHGTVTCIAVDGNVARIAGTWTDGGSFGLYVEDNGEGKAASDVVTLMPNEMTCDFDAPEDSDKVGLARGNAQVRDGA